MQLPPTASGNPSRLTALKYELDAVWSNILASADTLASREPLLARKLEQRFLCHPDLAHCLAALSAFHLADAELAESDLERLANDILEQDGSLVLAALADLLAIKHRDPACPSHLHTLLNLKGFQALQSYRLAHFLWRQKRPELALLLANAVSRRFDVDIHPAARLGSGIMLDHASGIVIGETCVVEDDVSILQEVTLGGSGKEDGDRHPKIRYGVMIGAGAKILGNIDVGANSKVAAGSVVLANVPPSCTVAGIPAKIVRWHGSNEAPSLDMNQNI